MTFPQNSQGRIWGGKLSYAITAHHYLGFPHAMYLCTVIHKQQSAIMHMRGLMTYAYSNKQFQKPLHRHPQTPINRPWSWHSLLLVSKTSDPCPINDTSLDLFTEFLHARVLRLLGGELCYNNWSLLRRPTRNGAMHGHPPKAGRDHGIHALVL